jgi:hypothetical protein
MYPSSAKLAIFLPFKATLYTLTELGMELQWVLFWHGVLESGLGVPREHM